MLDPSLLFPTTAGTISGSLLFGLSFGLPAALVLLRNLAALDAGALPGGRFGAAAVARGTRDVHHLMLAVLQAYALASCWKIWLNVGVGRERPDWYARVASGDAGAMKEGRASYPSGHAAYSHTSGAVCFWYLASVLGVFAGRSRASFALLVVAVAPVGLATYIGTTRLTDYRHHFSDVNAGTFIGLASGTLCYFLHFRAAALLEGGGAAGAPPAARVRDARGPGWATAGAVPPLVGGRSAQESEHKELTTVEAQS